MYAWVNVYFIFFKVKIPYPCTISTNDKSYKKYDYQQTIKWLLYDKHNSNKTQKVYTPWSVM